MASRAAAGKLPWKPPGSTELKWPRPRWLHRVVLAAQPWRVVHANPPAQSRVVPSKEGAAAATAAAEDGDQAGDDDAAAHPLRWP
jgi:hypothetical protein